MVTVKSDKPPICIVPHLYTFENPIYVTDDHNTMQELYNRIQDLEDQLAQRGQRGIDWD